MSNDNSGGATGGVIAPPYARERERMASLRALQILDKPGAARFDRLTTLAASALNLPVTLISLVDENRQWFLSRHGTDLTETVRSCSLCSHAILEDVMLIIEDTLEDARFKDNRLVVNEPFLRFYAGVVMRDNEGLPLGTFCVMSTEPRKFGKQEQDILIQLAALAETELLPDKSPLQQRVRSQLDARIDPLTRAFSPDRFNSDVEELMATEQGQFAAVAIVVVPGLDQLNDIFGRTVGDEVLVDLAERLSQIGRRFDRHSIGRLSGRRFALCVSGEQVQGPIYPLSEAVSRSLGQPFNTSGGELLPDIQSGIAVRQSETTSADAILERCRAALATAASTRGAQVVVYDESYLLPLHRRLRLAAELHGAIDSDALNLVYQPKIRCTDRAIDGFECLLRWQHKELGHISPLDILDAASDVNKLVALDRWVIDHAIEQRAAWQSAELAPGTLSVNITGETLLSDGFAPWLAERLNHHGVNPSHIELEVLESSLFEDFDHAVSILNLIKGLGVSISLDDFGTGYSSLAYLYRLPITVLKIDRAFISRLEFDSVHRSLCDGILSIAQNLKLSVVAEGVENESQFEILKATSCDRVQGYLFSRPVSPAEATSMMAMSSFIQARAA